MNGTTAKLDWSLFSIPVFQNSTFQTFSVYNVRWVTNPLPSTASIKSHLISAVFSPNFSSLLNPNFYIIPGWRLSG